MYQKYYNTYADKEDGKESIEGKTRSLPLRSSYPTDFFHPSFAQETSSEVSGGEECTETRSLTSCPFFFFV